MENADRISTYRFQVGLFDFVPCHFTLTDLSGILVDINKGSSSILGQLDLFNWASLFSHLDSLLGKEGGSCRLDHDGRRRHSFVQFGR